MTGFWRRVLLGPDEFADAEYRAEEYPLRLDNGTFAEWIGAGSPIAGVPVSQQSSLGLAAVYRAVSLISGTIATLPLKSYRDLSDGTRKRTDSFLDSPGGPDGLTQFEWTELVMVHLLLWGNAYLLHLYAGAGHLVGLIPLHPSAVEVKPVQTKQEEERFSPWLKYFTVTKADGSKQDLTPMEVTHVMAMGTDGLKGLSPIEANRQAIATGLAGDRAAAKMFGSGGFIAGLVTTEDDDVNADEAKAIRAGLDAKLSGVDNAGKWAFVNRRLKFTPWTMPASDAQFIESRIHQVEEVSRIFGVPPHLLGQTEKQTSWGTGVTEQNRGLARYTLMGWTSRLEQRLARLLNKQTCEYDYAGLLQGSPQEELTMLIAQVEAGILTVDEARRVRNLEPLTAPALESENA